MEIFRLDLELEAEELSVLIESLHEQRETARSMNNPENKEAYTELLNDKRENIALRIELLAAKAVLLNGQDSKKKLFG